MEAFLRTQCRVNIDLRGKDFFVLDGGFFSCLSEVFLILI